ncbi:DUF1801 domain-containing protein [Reinekea marina]|uniref:DUF1801 domain-containing protein n=1 Tax=Reinekea marina TaxID=1310421 RepID=A0ABV7WY17_9GAMM|nr:DUF1801 domain-containing protein [Reinekea marina]MDN3647493.1 DUF1801 domain-containing protein [Reinekea marina]
MTTNKTQPTDVPVSEFLKTVTVKRRLADAEVLLELFTNVTGQEAVMWGPSIIGFGQMEFHYDSGRSGIMPVTAFSPRKANLTLYVGDKFEGAASLYERLGKYKKSVACLYINKLDDVDLNILTEIVRADYLANMRKK